MSFSITKEWLIAALTRAIKTMAQTALGMITVGAAIQDLNLANILSVAIVAGIYSILTSIVTGVPEADIAGNVVKTDKGLEMQFDDYDQYHKFLQSNKKQVTLKVVEDVSDDG